MRKPRPKLVTIWWVDACTDSHAQHDYNPEQIAKDCGLYENRETSGYFIWADEVKTILAHDWDAAENQVANMTVIPTPWIKRRRGFPKVTKETSDGTAGAEPTLPT